MHRKNKASKKQLPLVSAREALYKLCISRKHLEYHTSPNNINIKTVNEIVFNDNSATVSNFKDLLIMNEDTPYIVSFSSTDQAREDLKLAFLYYSTLTCLLPNTFCHSTNTYLLKNTHRKQNLLKALKLKETEQNLSIMLNSKLINEIENSAEFSEAQLTDVSLDNLIKNIGKFEKKSLNLRFLGLQTKESGLTDRKENKLKIKTKMIKIKRVEPRIETLASAVKKQRYASSLDTPRNLRQSTERAIFNTERNMVAIKENKPKIKPARLFSETSTIFKSVLSIKKQVKANVTERISIEVKNKKTRNVASMTKLKTRLKKAEKLQILKMVYR